MQFKRESVNSQGKCFIKSSRRISPGSAGGTNASNLLILTAPFLTIIDDFHIVAMAITPTKQIRYCLLGVARGLYIRVRDENDCLHYRGSYRLHRSALCTTARSPFDGREPASRLSPGKSIRSSAAAKPPRKVPKSPSGRVISPTSVPRWNFALHGCKFLLRSKPTAPVNWHNKEHAPSN